MSQQAEVRIGRRSLPLPLRNRPFAQFFAGTTTSLLGTAVATVALPLVAIVVLSASPVMVGALSAAVWTPWLLIGLPAGAWADRYSPRRLVVLADVVSAVLYAAVPVLVALHALTMWYLVVLAFAAGGSEVVSQAALGVVPPMLVDDEDLESANATLQGAESTSELFGPLGNSLLTRLFGVTAGLAVNAVSFLVSAVAVGLTEQAGRPGATGQAGAATPPLRDQIWDGLRELFGHPLLRRLAITGAVVNTALTAFAVLHPLFLLVTLRLPAAMVGVLLVGEGVAGVLGAAVAPRVARRLGPTRALGAICAVSFPFTFLIPLASRGAGLALFVGGTAVPLFGVVAANVLMRTLRQRAATPGSLGRVAAGSRMFAYATSPLAALLTGVVAAAIGTRWTYALFGILLLGTAVSFVVSPLAPPQRRAADRARAGAPAGPAQRP